MPKEHFVSADPRVDFAMIEARYERGVHLPAQDLWLDPWEAKRFAFVSHAHSDHIAPHDEIILSEGTARLMQARLPGTRTEHVLPFGAPRRVHNVEVTLLPAGHIFGSAQLLLSAENETLLYTSDFKLRPGKSAEKIPRKRVAMISGWAIDSDAIYRYQVEAAFPLSDHADYNDLLRYVELIQPNRVLTLHGFAAQFARDLQDRGIKPGR